ncbi:MAG: hypothetical protein ACYTGR_17415 [Planctomycetota bacterium]|jgi:hypothetical protein
MAVSRERKVLFTVLGAGLMALVVDRVFLGGYTAAVATAEAASVEPAPPIVSEPSAPVRYDDRATLVAATYDRFETYARENALDVEQAPDAFSPRGQWIVRQAAHVEIVSLTADDVRERYELNAVMLGTRDDSRALINGRLHRLGAALDGMRIVMIGERRVVLRSGDLEVQLDLKDEDAD